MIGGVKALVIAHDHLSDAGLLRAPLEAAGFAATTLLVVGADRFDTPDVRIDFPDVHGFDLVVPVGAPWSVYDDARLGSWVAAERDLLRAADTAGVPVLGVCFGGQQLAVAHGGAVTRAPAPEIGWRRVTTEAPELIEPGPWLEWHFDRWEPPPGAPTLARTPAAPQAFRLRRNLALQFHPEVDEKILRSWLDNGGAAALCAHGGDPDTLLAETVDQQDAAADRAARLVRRFLDAVS
jgi:GMP synthase-like glutamine amidotransferase